MAGGRTANDGNGDRKFQLVFPRGTTVQVTKGNGSTATVTKSRVRATEFTIGSDGAKSMPAKDGRQKSHHEAEE